MRVRKGGGEEIPLVQGKEQRLRFAGAAMKRYPTCMKQGTQRQCSEATQRDGVATDPAHGVAQAETWMWA